MRTVIFIFSELCSYSEWKKIKYIQKGYEKNYY